MTDACHLKILHVEDDEVDREALQRAFEQSDIPCEIVAARDGLEALDLLRSRVPAMLRPYLVLLDLNMPRMDGIEFLRELRADRRLADTLVFVVTTSMSEEDRALAYSQQIAGYIAKSEIGTEFHRLAEMLQTYWRLVEPPA